MTFLPRSTWRYAILIVVLFAVAAFAASQTISFLNDELSELGQDPASEIARLVTWSIWLLTLGFMFLAGALGLWGIRTSVEIESRRRIARLVNAMDYLADGMIMLDSSGNILAANPAVNSFAANASPYQSESIQHIFPMLAQKDIERLLTGPGTREIECDADLRHGRRTLRFRSHHAIGVNLLIVSDVTDVKSEEVRRKQIAQLQLLGRIAAGVAHDFNNILCAVSGHADLIARLAGDPEAMRQSLNFILAEADRGAQLSRQLLELSRSNDPEPLSRTLDENIEEAAGLLRVALSPAWSINATIQGKFAAVPLAPSQIEQMVLNLGLLAADAQQSPGNITITLSRPGAGQLTDVDPGFAAVIIISAESGSRHGPPDAALALKDDRLLPAMADSGVIHSIVRSLVEEIGGRLDHLGGTGAPSVYRVCLPHLQLPDSNLNIGGLENMLRDRICGMRVMSVLPKQSADIMENILRPAGAEFFRVAEPLAALAELENKQNINLVVLHSSMMGNMPASFLRTMARINPTVAFLVLGVNDSAAFAESGLSVVVGPDSLQPDAMARLLLETPMNHS